MMSNVKHAVKRTLTFLLAFAMIVTSLYVAPVTAKADEVVEEVVEEAAEATVVEEVSEATQSDAAVVTEEIVEETVVEENTQIEADKLVVGTEETKGEAGEYWIGKKNDWKITDKAQLKAIPISMEDTYALQAGALIEGVFNDGTANQTVAFTKTSTLNGTNIECGAWYDDADGEKVVNNGKDEEKKNMTVAPIFVPGADTNANTALTANRMSDKPQYVAYITGAAYGSETTTFEATNKGANSLATDLETFISGLSGTTRKQKGLTVGDVITLTVELHRVECQKGVEGAHEVLAKGEVRFEVAPVVNSIAATNAMPIDIKVTTGLAISDSIKNELKTSGKSTVVKVKTCTTAPTFGTTPTAAVWDNAAGEKVTAWGAAAGNENGITFNYVKVNGEEKIWTYEGSNVVEEDEAIARLDAMKANDVAEVGFRVDTYSSGKLQDKNSLTCYGTAKVTVKDSALTRLTINDGLASPGKVAVNKGADGETTATSIVEALGIAPTAAGPTWKDVEEDTESKITVDWVTAGGGKAESTDALCKRLNVFDDRFKAETLTKDATGYGKLPKGMKAAGTTYNFGIITLETVKDANGKVVAAGKTAVESELAKLNSTNRVLKIGYKIELKTLTIDGDGDTPASAISSTVAAVKKDGKDVDPAFGEVEVTINYNNLYHVNENPDKTRPIKVNKGATNTTPLTDLAKAALDDTLASVIKVSNDGSGTTAPGAAKAAPAALSVYKTGASAYKNGGATSNVADSEDSGKPAVIITKMQVVGGTKKIKFDGNTRAVADAEAFLGGANTNTANDAVPGDQVLITFVVDALDGNGKVQALSENKSAEDTLLVEIMPAGGQIVIDTGEDISVKTPYLKTSEGEQTKKNVCRKVAEALSENGSISVAYYGEDPNPYSALSSIPIVGADEDFKEVSKYYWLVQDADSVTYDADTTSPLKYHNKKFSVTLKKTDALGVGGDLAASDEYGTDGSHDLSAAVTTAATGNKFYADVVVTPKKGSVVKELTKLRSRIDIAESPDETTANETARKELEAQILNNLDLYVYDEDAEAVLVDPAFVKIGDTAPTFGKGQTFESTTEGAIYYTVYETGVGASNGAVETAIKTLADGTDKGLTVTINAMAAGKDNTYDNNATPAQVTGLTVTGGPDNVDGKKREIKLAVHKKYQLTDDEQMAWIASNYKKTRSSVITLPVGSSEADIQAAVGSAVNAFSGVVFDKYADDAGLGTGKGAYVATYDTAVASGWADPTKKVDGEYAVSIGEGEIYWYLKLAGAPSETKNTDGVSGFWAASTGNTVTVTATAYGNDDGTQKAVAGMTALNSSTSSNVVGDYCLSGYTVNIVDDGQLASVSVPGTDDKYSATLYYKDGLTEKERNAKVLGDLKKYVTVYEMAGTEIAEGEGALVTQAEFDAEKTKNGIYYVYSLVGDTSGSALTWPTNIGYSNRATAHVQVIKYVYENGKENNKAKGHGSKAISDAGVTIIKGGKDGKIKSPAAGPSTYINNPSRFVVTYTSPEDLGRILKDDQLGQTVTVYVDGMEVKTKIKGQFTGTKAPDASELVAGEPNVYWTKLTVAKKEYKADGSNDEAIGNAVYSEFTKGSTKDDTAKKRPVIETVLTLKSFFVTEKADGTSVVSTPESSYSVTSQYSVEGDANCSVTLSIYRDASKKDRAVCVEGSIIRGKVIGNVDELSSQIKAYNGGYGQWIDVDTGKVWDIMTDPVNKDVELYAIENAKSKDVSTNASISYAASGITNVVYNGKVQKLKPTILKTVANADGTKTTTDVSKSVKISYTDEAGGKATPKNAGTYVIKVYDKKEKADAMEITFKIEKASLETYLTNDPAKRLASKVGTYKEGKATTVTGYKTIKVNGGTAKLGTDYTFEFDEKYPGASDLGSGKLSFEKTGRYVVNVKALAGSVNFTDSTDFSVYVADKAHQLKSAKVNFSKKSLVIDGSSDYYPTFTLTAGGQSFYTKGGEDGALYTMLSQYDKEVNDSVNGGLVGVWMRQAVSKKTGEAVGAWVPGTYVVRVVADGRNEWGLVGEKDIVYTVKADKNYKLNKKMYTDTAIGLSARTKAKSIIYDGREWTLEDVLMSTPVDTDAKGKDVYLTKAEAVDCINSSVDKAVYNKDFTVEYKKNIDAGTATATFTALPGSRYSGSFKVTYKIQKVDLKKTAMAVGNAATTATDTSYVYVDAATINAASSWTTSGKNKLVLTDAAKSSLVTNLKGVDITNAETDASGKVVATGLDLIDGKDFTMGYKYNKSGITSMTVKGKKNYSGSIVIPFVE